MTISVWWLIGVLQFTLCAIGICVFYAVSGQIAKKQNHELKALVAKTAHDYTNFMDTMATNPEASDSSNTTQSQETTPNNTYDFCLALYSTGMDNMPTWDAMLPHTKYEYSQLKTVIELHIAHMLMQDDPEQAQSSWQTFIETLQQDLIQQTTHAKKQAAILQSIHEQWLEKKSALNSIFNDLVILGQQTDVSNQIHEATNEMYTIFVNILNTIPTISEIPQDAFLKMEAIAKPAPSQSNTKEQAAIEKNLPPDIDEETSVQEHVIEIEVANSQPAERESELETTKHQENQLPETHHNNAIVAESSNEITPETIMPLSQDALDFDDDDDQLDVPASAIAEFIVSAPKKSKQSATAPLPHPATQKKAEDTGVDDDIFDDLLNTMDDIIGENENKKNANNS